MKTLYALALAALLVGCVQDSAPGAQESLSPEEMDALETPADDLDTLAEDDTLLVDETAEDIFDAGLEEGETETL